MLRAARLGGEDLGEAGSLVADGGQGQLPDRHPSGPPVPPDLLEQLHTRPRHPKPPRQPNRRKRSDPGWGHNSPDDTPAHPPGEITIQAGPKSATTTGQTGASSADHTQR